MTRREWFEWYPRDWFGWVLVALICLLVDGFILAAGFLLGAAVSQ